jgi:hypothetical protein
MQRRWAEKSAHEEPVPYSARTEPQAGLAMAGLRPKPTAASKAPGGGGGAARERPQARRPRPAARSGARTHAPPPPSPCTKWTRLVLPPVLRGQVSSFPTHAPPTQRPEALGAPSSPSSSHAPALPAPRPRRRPGSTFRGSCDGRISKTTPAASRRGPDTPLPLPPHLHVSAYDSHACARTALRRPAGRPLPLAGGHGWPRLATVGAIERSGVPAGANGRGSGARTCPPPLY